MHNFVRTYGIGGLQSMDQRILIVHNTADWHGFIITIIILIIIIMLLNFFVSSLLSQTRVVAD